MADLQSLAVERSFNPVRFDGMDSDRLAEGRGGADGGVA